MDEATLLLRQVHPDWSKDGRVTSQLFKATMKGGTNRREISVYDGSQIDPEESWVHFTKEMGRPSVGVMAVTVSECLDQNVKVVPDSATFKEHMLLNFDGMTRGVADKVAHVLVHIANRRGWLFRQ